MKVTLSDKQRRYVLWWAKRQGLRVDQVINSIFDGFFLVVSGEFERATAARKPKRRKAAR
jgi:hypothetical protein